jgi:hypothetical protein
MNASNTIPRRRAIEMLGAGTLMATALRYAPAGDQFNAKPRILFFSKSSGYEHDVVRRTAKGPSLSEATLAEIGRASTSSPPRMGRCSTVTWLNTTHFSFSRLEI